MMESNQGKLYVSGLPWDATEDTLRDYFSNYGVVTRTVIVCDENTGHSRGFGFVTYADPSVLDRSHVLTDKHAFGYTVVTAKRAYDKYTSRKIFVRGLPPSLTEQGVREYFETFGQVRWVEVLSRPNNQRPSWSGYVYFATKTTVDKVLNKISHKLGGMQIDVIRASSQKVNPGSASAVNNPVNPYSQSYGYGSAYGGYGHENAGTSNRSNQRLSNHEVAAMFASMDQTPSTSMAYGYGNPNSSSNSMFVNRPDQNLSDGNQAYGNGNSDRLTSGRNYPAGRQHISSGSGESNTNSGYQGAWRYNTPLARGGGGGGYHGSGYDVAQPRQNQQR